MTQFFIISNLYLYSWNDISDFINNPTIEFINKLRCQMIEPRIS